MNARLHGTSETFGDGGARWAEMIKEQIDVTNEPVKTILDYGCGKGALASCGSMRGYEFTEYEPSRKDRCRVPMSPEDVCDVVVCSEVLEHIEPERISYVVAHIAVLTKRFAFLTIALRLSNKKLDDGRNAHLIIKPREWWREQLESHFNVIEIPFRNRNKFIVRAEPC